MDELIAWAHSLFLLVGQFVVLSAVALAVFIIGAYIIDVIRFIISRLIKDPLCRVVAWVISIILGALVLPRVIGVWGVAVALLMFLGLILYLFVRGSP